MRLLTEYILVHSSSIPFKLLLVIFRSVSGGPLCLLLSFFSGHNQMLEPCTNQKNLCTCPFNQLISIFGPF